MPKQRLLRKIDAQPTRRDVTSGAAGAAASSNVVPPARPAITEPLNLALTTAIGYSSAAPTAVINATWDPPYDAIPQFYQINVSTSSSFTASGTIMAQANTESAHIESLLPATLYYVRVRAWAGGIAGAWSDVKNITTASDTTAAGVPTGIGAVWIGIGDLLITWTNPTEANLKDVQIVVRASSGGTIYRTTYSAAGRFLYTLAMNIQDTAGAKDSSLYVELRSRTFSNVLGTTVNTGLVTKAAPATPTGVSQSWSGDTGTAGPDLIVSWALADDAAYYRLALDGTNYYPGGSSGSYTYTWETNRNQHGSAADPVISYSLVAVDGFGQVSTAVSGTATNAAPPTPTVTLTAGFSILIAAVGGTQAADFAAYEFVFKRDGSAVRTLESKAAEQQYELSAAADEGYHSWTCAVRQKDLFGQYSSTVTSSAQAFETLTLSGLRDGIVYSDSLATSPATLKSALADGVTTSGGISYNA